MVLIERTNSILRKKLFLNISFVIVLVIMGIFLGIFFRNRQLINEMILTRARTNFYSIVLTRKWNARYGGVYVEKRKGIVSNPYFKNPDIITDRGKIYTLKNPALMTREISRFGTDEGLFTYRITSLKPLNPSNSADSFERDALEKFTRGTKEAFRIIDEEGKSIFRYMAPLHVEKSCLKCHVTQGYKVGDIRGGISVTFEISDLQKILKEEKLAIIALSVLSVLILLGLIFWFATRVLNKLRNAYAQIELLAVTDDLTGLYNRRYFFMRFEEEMNRSRRYGAEIGCIMIDLDHFKRVNDVYGHQSGDIVLKNISNMIKEISRGSDVVARYGGEEIIVLLPETDVKSAVVFAEKIRKVIEESEMPVKGMNEPVTASFGVSSMDYSKAPGCSEEVLIVRADRALYIAKDKGRNRVEYYPEGGDDGTCS